MIYVVIACHFELDEWFGYMPCDTTIVRLEAAQKAVTEDDSIMVTGDMSYELGGPTLGHLMADWLRLSGFTGNIIMLHGGVGMFSEARLVCNILEGKEVTVVSSSWYFVYGRLIWEMRALEKDIDMYFISVPKTGGWRVRLVYFALGVIVDAVIFVGLGQILEDYVFTKFQQKRRKGFTLDRCK